MTTHAVVLLFSAAVVSHARPQAAQTRQVRCKVIVSPSDTDSWRFSAVAPGPGGLLAWTDGRSGQFSVRDPLGRVRSIGRQGAGPGEFQAIGAMDWLGDSLWVADGLLPRVQVFSDTGRFLGVITATRPAGWGLTRDGSLVGFAGVPLGRDVPFAVLSYTPKATTVDTVGVFQLVPAERFALPPRMALNKQPLLPETVVGWNASHDRFCGATPAGTGQIRVRCLDGRGVVVVDRSVPLEPRPLTNAIYDDVIKAWARGPERSEAVMRDLIRRPRVLPLALELKVENEGGIWLRRTHASEPVAVWARLRSDGSLREQVQMPRGFNLLRVGADALWATSADADGLQTLHVCTPVAQPAGH